MDPEPGKTYDPETMPFVAPCRELGTFAAFTWVRLGIDDLRHAPRESLLYGLVMAALVGGVTIAAWRYGAHWLMLSVVCGLVFLAPLLCIGLYAISAQLEREQPVSLARSLRAAFRRYLGNEMLFALVLMVIFFVWARSAMLVIAFLVPESDMSFGELRPFLTVGTVVGAVFAAITFSASAFSLPMIMHRNVDTITAIVTSVNAVLRNKRAMLVWLALILIGLLLGVATAFIGLIFILPIIGFAAWHGYLETIDSAAFPRHEAGITAVPRTQSPKL